MSENVLRQLPPPWSATRKEIADATVKVGSPIVYQLGTGWVTISGRAAAAISVVMQFGSNRG